MNPRFKDKACFILSKKYYELFTKVFTKTLKGVPSFTRYLTAFYIK